MLIGRLPCDCSPTELPERGTCKAPTCQRTRSSLDKARCHWSQRGYSKPRPPRYECGALPLELLRHGAGAENRTPLIGLAIRCPANRPHPQKVLERTEIIEISSLGWRPRAQPIYHARSYATSVMLFSCQRPASRYTSTKSLLGQSELDKMPQITDKTKKTGGPFWWPPAS